MSFASRVIGLESMAPAKSLRELLQAVRPPWKKKDLEAIEARLSRLGIFSVQETHRCRHDMYIYIYMS